MKQEMKDRLEQRLKNIKACKTPQDVAYAIWTKQLEEAIGSRDSYRNSFINWVDAYRYNRTPTEWSKYKTPQELAEAIWDPKLEMGETDKIWFGGLRSTLVDWINKYANKLNPYK